MWKTTSELGFNDVASMAWKHHAIAQTQLREHVAPNAWDGRNLNSKQAQAKRAAVVFQTPDPGGPLAEALAAFVDDAPAFARRVHATRYAPLEAFYEALRDSDAAPAPAGGVAGPTDGARFYRNAADAKRPRAAPQKDFYRNQAARALDKLRAAGVADVVLAHLLELWGLRRCGDAARLGPLLLGDE